MTSSRPESPKPAKLLLPYTEAETLEAIRERPGVTTGELVEEMGLAMSTIKNRVKMLKRGGHVKGEGFNSDGFSLLLPTHNRPIGKVKSREKTRWPRWRSRAGDAQDKSVRCDADWCSVIGQ